LATVKILLQWRKKKWLIADCLVDESGNRLPIRFSDRDYHLGIFAETGSGKTTAIAKIIESTHRSTDALKIVIFDGKGGIDLPVSIGNKAQIVDVAADPAAAARVLLEINDLADKMRSIQKETSIRGEFFYVWADGMHPDATRFTPHLIVFDDLGRYIDMNIGKTKTTGEEVFADTLQRILAHGLETYRSIHFSCILTLTTARKSKLSKILEESDNLSLLLGRQSKSQASSIGIDSLFFDSRLHKRGRFLFITKQITKVVEFTD